MISVADNSSNTFDIKQLSCFDTNQLDSSLPLELLCQISCCNIMVSAKKKRAQRQKQYMKNKDAARVDMKEYYENNKSPIKLSQNEYYEQNKDAKKQSRNQRYEENKDVEK